MPLQSSAQIFLYGISSELQRNEFGGYFLRVPDGLSQLFYVWKGYMEPLPAVDRATVRISDIGSYVQILRFVENH